MVSDIVSIRKRIVEKEAAYRAIVFNSYLWQPNYSNLEGLP